MNPAVPYAEIPAAEAMKHFAGRDIKVQAAKLVPGVVKDHNGRERPGKVFDVKVVPLAEEHVIAAKRYANGKITIVTVDGQRYSVTAAPISSE